MRCAFVLKLGPGTQPAEGRFAGWIEEVDTGIELRFQSTTQLLDFLKERVERDALRQQPSPSPGTRKPSQGES